jgi:pimeloyl-ACP methyl ester carboxylesterase
MAVMGEAHLVLLPGMLLDEELFSHQVEHLSEVAEVKVGDVTGSDTVAGMAQQVLRDAPERFALAGLSLGGIVAFEIMRRAPERVERLALLDTNARPPRPEQLEVWKEFARMTEDGRFSEVTEKHIMPTLVHPERKQDADLMDGIRRMAASVGEEGFLRQLSAQETRPDSRERLKDISCPTLVAVGRQDTLCPVELHEEIASAISGAVLVVIEDCSHLSSMEQPQAVTALLRYWLLHEYVIRGERG